MAAAARRLKVTPTNIRNVVRRSEDVLGFPLFHLQGGKLVPTDEASVLFRVVDQFHGKLEAARETARNLRGGLDSYLRVSVLPSLGLAVAPAAIRRLLQSDARVRIDVQTLHHDELPRALNERDCDLAIGFDAMTNDPSLHSFQNRTRRTGLALSKGSLSREAGADSPLGDPDERFHFRHQQRPGGRSPLPRVENS